MTTISLFYLALYKFLSENIPDPTDIDQQLELRGLRNRIIINESKTIRLHPSYTSQNLEDYKWLFSDNIEEFRNLSKPKNIGNRRMFKAFNYFYNRLIEVDENQNPKYNYSQVSKILNKYNSATLVKIDVANHTDAFILFETLNNRGVPLSAIDLIKNKLLGVLQKENEDIPIDESFDRWNKILINLTDDYTIQERFLRQFYNALNNDVKIKVEKKSKALRSNLIAIYEELINRDVNFIFDRLEEASMIYSKHNSI